MRFFIILESKKVEREKFRKIKLTSGLTCNVVASEEFFGDDGAHSTNKVVFYVDLEDRLSTISKKLCEKINRHELISRDIFQVQVRNLVDMISSS